MLAPSERSFSSSRSTPAFVSTRPLQEARLLGGLFALYGQGEVPKDFMGPADRIQPPQDRDPFADWKE